MPKENPFRHMGKYYWTDENGATHGPFPQQKDALYDCLTYSYPDFKGHQLDESTKVLLEALGLIIGIGVLWWWLI
jgi:hypothetical protein